VGKRGPFGILARGPTATLLRHWHAQRHYRQTVPHIDNFISKLRRSYLARFFCNLKPLRLVVKVGDVVKFGIAAESYLPDSIL